jgi:hypothetical protein
MAERRDLMENYYNTIRKVGLDILKSAVYMHTPPRPLQN